MMQTNKNQNLLTRFPPIEPFNTGMLQVDDVHVLYYEQSGNPDGEPVVFLHGGPGEGSQPKHREYFNPNHYRIITFDQRGCGQSVPFGELKNNTTQHLVDDIEKLRSKLGLEKIHVFGGSWGSALALCYAIKHPEQVASLTMSGIFLMTKKELAWDTNGKRALFPEAWEKMANYLTTEEQKDIAQSYYDRINNSDDNMSIPAAKMWRTYGAETFNIITSPNGELEKEEEESQIAQMKALMPLYYHVNHMFVPDDYILNNKDKIKHIPTTIIHGECDVICLIETAYDLHKALPNSKFITIPNAGHSSSEPLTTHELIKATNKLIK